MRFFVWLAFISAVLAAETAPPLEVVAIGALVPDAWNGVAFVTKSSGRPANFAMRIGSRHGRFLDGADILDAVSEVGANAPDGSYAKVTWRHAPRIRDISLEWSRLDVKTVVGRLTAKSDVELVLEAYSPPFETSCPVLYALGSAPGVIWGERFFDGAPAEVVRLLVQVDRPVTSSGLYDSLERLRQSVTSTGRLQGRVAAQEGQEAAGLQFHTSEDGTAHFVVAVGSVRSELEGRAEGLLATGRIDSILNQRAQEYASRRPSALGLFEGAPEAIGNTLFWDSVYAPGSGLVFPSISRKWALNFGGWAFGEWDCFFDALLTSLEDHRQTADGIRAVLLTQTETGVVSFGSGSGTTPDRSQPPVGAWMVWKVYSRFRDRDLLAWAYPRLKKWHESWLRDRGDGQPRRDGNRNGLLEWGSDRGNSFSVGGRGAYTPARYESGMDDSPMYDDVAYNASTYTLELDDVSLNSLYALDAECLSKLAAILGLDEDERRFAAEYEKTKGLVRAHLWNEEAGIYQNRHWNGKFSPRLSPTSFYPMLAGIATEEQANRMVKEHVLNPGEFWGEYVIPTIARNDPSWGDQFYWRGDIWGPTNYMVYHGLNRYGFDEIALEFALKSSALFMRDWRERGYSGEAYYAWGSSAGDQHYTWGALLLLIALEQYSDCSPWDGLRFGALDPPARGRLRGIVWNGQVHDVTIGPDETALSRDGAIKFQADAGLVVRNYMAENHRLSFEVKSSRGVKIRISEFASGTVALKVDGSPRGTVPVEAGSVELNVAGGEHRVHLSVLRP